jgi:lipoprotein NlpI
LDPKLADAWQRRGEDHFRIGKITESISDFDAYLKLEPSEKPYHWQRGISLYYAGRFAEGKQQFELHQTVNSQDVENAVWHFLCTARAEGLESARKKLIPISADSRVPMAQVHRLFAGKGTVADVLTAARAAPANAEAGEPLFYAHLYLGLYYEATGDNSHAKAEILQAAERADQNGYMGDVARVYAERLRKTAADSKP